MTHSTEVALQLVLGVIGLLDTRLELVVDAIELAPHGVGEGTQRCINLASQLLAVLSLLLRATDVLLRELHPRVRHRDPAIGDNANR